MGDTEQQASATAAAEAAKGDQSGKTQTPAEAEAEAQRKQQPSAEEQLKAANDKLAVAGRETKAERTRREALEAEVEQLRTEKDKLWFTHPDTPEEQKDEFRRRREAEAKDAPKLAQANNRIVLAEAIADEENPTIRKALKFLQTKAKESGKYPDSSTIAALRESLAPDEGASGSGKQTEEETPVGVSSSRGTQSVSGPTIDEQIKVVEESVRKRDGKYTYADLLGLRQAKTQQVATAARG